MFDCIDFSAALCYSFITNCEAGDTMNATEQVRERLFADGDEKYAEFQRKLIPTVAAESVIGVRAPLLRAYAKELRGSEAANGFMSALPHKYFDENTLHGLLISDLKNPDEIVERLDVFLPFIDNWATCDMTSPKSLAKNRALLSAKALEWISSDKPYTVRFGVNMFMQFFLGENFRVEYAEQIANIRSEEYYVKMGVAWYFATALAKNYEETLPFIRDCRLDTWTQNKAIQKAVESFRVTEEHKAVLRGYKIKK